MSSFLKEYISTGFLFLVTGGFQYQYYRHTNNLYVERDKLYKRFKNPPVRAGVK